LGDGDATFPSSEIATPSSISSPTEPTKSTNLEETESSNQMQDLTEMASRLKNVETEVSDTRQMLSLIMQNPEYESKPSSGTMETSSRDD